ncbi:High-affinity zinc uptake system membrane protein ZnuB [Corynebacterium capitovis DSM 44611]|uniref:metal ABC transporter permease n=1 Tax=Corynebacterium capitovis TaxID=131081 RepID=UPI000363B0A8|nr:metal ABC transporter permease [Corynebacterium capitovis]WKD57130.1 High-affinity zinc uptake system membrane protein ZnuB [Corynebacterium capitovis DSM 44611]
MTFAELLEATRAGAQYVPGLATVASAPYLFRPFVMLLALAVSAGIAGTLVNLRRAEFTAEAVSHSVFPGIVAGFIVAGLDGIVPGGAVVGVVAATVLTLAAQRAAAADEAGTAIVLSTFYAVGLVLSLAHSDKSGQLEALMFGRLLEVSPERLGQALLACACAVALLCATWPAQLAVAYDRVLARASGIRVQRYDAVFNVAVAATVVAGASAVGVLLVVGFLVVPAASARLVARSPRSMACWATGVAAVSSYAGMAVAAAPPSRPVSPQACVVVALLVALVLTVAGKGLVNRARRH